MQIIKLNMAGRNAERAAVARLAVYALSAFLFYACGLQREAGSSDMGWLSISAIVASMTWDAEGNDGRAAAMQMTPNCQRSAYRNSETSSESNSSARMGR